MKFVRTVSTTTLLSLALALGVSADQLQPPVTTEVERTQHFSKYMMKNSSSVPITVTVNAQGDNLKTTKSMPHILVIPPRSTKEAFTASAKDPRVYYSTPDVQEDYKFGDYRIRSSNMRLTFPWAKGESFKALEGEEKNGVAFELPEGTDVLCGRMGLVVNVDDDLVMVAHNDGSVSRYSGLSQVKAKLGKEMRGNEVLGVAGEDPLQFTLLTPDRSMNYRAIPAQFYVNGQRTVLTPGTEYSN